ncbi:MAG: hypothetical protein ACOC2F_00260 [Bacteroidota bacterium]
MKIVRHFFIAFFLLVSGRLAYSQTDITQYVEQSSHAGGKVTIHQSEDIYKALNEHVHYLRNEKGIPGYRIRIFSTGQLQDAREQATRERSRFVKLYPDINADLDYQAPFWKVYVGNFVRINEALKVKNKIIDDFPTAFIVPYDNISYTIKK